MNTQSRYLGMILLAGLTLACEGEGGTHIGNPSTSTIGLSLTVVSSDSTGTSSLTFDDDNGTTYILTSASVYIREIELDLPEGMRCADVASSLAGGAECKSGENSGGRTIVVPGPFVVDLVNRSSTPGLANVRVPQVRYDRVDFRIDDGRPEDGLIQDGDPLDDLSLIVSANFTYMDVSARLSLALKFNEDVRFEAPGGIEPPADGTLVAQLDVSSWLDGVRIGDCLDDDDLEITDGVLLIDDSAGSGDCSTVEGDLKTNIKNSAQLGGE